MGYRTMTDFTSCNSPPRRSIKSVAVNTKKLKANDDNRLAKTRYTWIKNLNNLSEKQQTLFDETYDLQLQTGKAWAYREVLRDLWTQPDTQTAKQYFKDWYRSVIHTKLEPMKRVARTIKERLTNVVSYCKHKITNAVAEGINSKIMAIKTRVGGYRNKQNFKTAVFFYCGGLQIYPH